MMNYLNIAREKNLPKIMSIQNSFSLLNRIFDTSHSEVSIKENCKLLAYSPLAGGRLSGKYLKGKKPKYSRYTLYPKNLSRQLVVRGESAITKYLGLAEVDSPSFTALTWALKNLPLKES